MKRKGITDHQIVNLRYIMDCERRGEHVNPKLLNMSVLAGLMRRKLVDIVPLDGAADAIKEAEVQR